jgi:hypothetical protein
MGLSEIFRPPGILGDMWVSISKSRFNTWGKIQSNLLGKVEKASEGAKFSLKGEIGLSEIFRPPGMISDALISLSKPRFNT